MNQESVKKIILVWPPADKRAEEFKVYPVFLDKSGPYPPLGLIYLASSLKNIFSDFQIQILDGEIYSLDGIIDQIGRSMPDVVGISPANKSYFSALEIARFSKSIGAKVVFGGAHATGLAREILINRGSYSKDYCVDFVIKEDGEQAFGELLKGVDYPKINNLVWIDKFGKIVQNRIKNIELGKQKIIDRDFVDVELYFKKQGELNRSNRFRRGLSMISQKGCAWRCRTGGCIFCSRINKRINFISPTRFWEEIIFLVRRYNIDMIWDVRDDFLENKQWLKEVVNLRPTMSELNKLWLRSYARIDRVSDEIVKMLERFYMPIRFAIGFESGSSKMLKTMNKGYTAKKAFLRAKALSSSGIRIGAGFVLGAPGESKKTLLETIKFAQKLKKLGAGVSPHLLEPLPNSVSFRMLLDKYGSKYAGRDDINIYELIRDWIQNFCQADLKDISRTYEIIEDMN